MGDQPVTRSLAVAAAALLTLAACGGGGTRSTSPLPPLAVTIPAPAQYLVQSANPDGNPTTPLTAATPWSYERFDFGDMPGAHFQAEQSFLNPDGSVETIWSYPPYGNAVCPNGDAGEVYKPSGDAAQDWYIAETQNCPLPAPQQFGTGWWMFDQYTPACDGDPAHMRVGPDGVTRACHLAVTYPATGVPGNAIAADTVISEHFASAINGRQMERFYWALGWGRLAWQAWYATCPYTAPPDLNPAQRAPTISFDGPPADFPAMLKCDERLVTNIVAPPPVAGLTGAGWGWP